MYDILIIGAGTGGLSAAIYGNRAGKSVLVMESASYGGQIINSPEVENYPGIKHISGFEFATQLYEQAVEQGAEIAFENAKQLEDRGDYKVVTDENGKTYEARTVILATGAKNRPLGVDRETQLIGAGISYCATCDGAFFRQKEVAVVGGGNTALEDATFLSNYCSKVYLVHRRDAFRGEDKQVENLRMKPNVEMVLNSLVLELIGEDRVEGLRVQDKVSGQERILPVSGVFVAIGQEPENQRFSPLVQLDEKGYIVAGENCKTNVPGIFTAGDCRTKQVRQLATAAADGAVAALAACEYIG